jgi:type IV secretion system protein VirB5
MQWLRRPTHRVVPDSLPPGGDGRNHLIAARHEFANAFGDLARGKRNWQVMAFTLAGLLGVTTVAYIRLASSARLVPYVVQVDRVGQVVAAGLVDELQAPNQRLVASQLAHFIRSIRTVLPSPAGAAQAEMVRQAYAFLGPEAAAFLNDYFAQTDNDPRVLGARITRLVTVTSVLRVPESEVWKLRWTEEERPLQGGGATRMRAWEGYVTVRIVPPRTADAIELNPLGIHIVSLTWTEIAEGSAELSSHGGGRP